MLPKPDAGLDACTVLGIECEGEKLLGILHEGDSSARVAVVIVVGGGQYRVGAHRQFVELARVLSSHGVPVLRFDVRGMGDNGGAARHFLELNDDLEAAVDSLMSHRRLDGVVLWGLCDGATASMLYAPKDDRVRGVVLVNPWISTNEGVARTVLRHHYTAQLKDPLFWRRLRQGQVGVLTAIGSLIRTVAQSVVGRKRDAGKEEPRLPDLVFAALSRYDKPSLVVISEQDMTAREFDDEWTKRVVSGQLVESAERSVERMQADHTFTDPNAQARLASVTVEWLRRMVG